MFRKRMKQLKLIFKAQLLDRPRDFGHSAHEMNIPNKAEIVKPNLPEINWAGGDGDGGAAGDGGFVFHEGGGEGSGAEFGLEFAVFV